MGGYWHTKRLQKNHVKRIKYITEKNINKKITIQPIFSYRKLFKSFFSSKKSITENLYQSGSAALYAALSLIMLKKNIKKICVPKFICNEVVLVIDKLNLNLQFYDIDSELNIIINDNLKRGLSDDTAILVINYFGFSSDWDLINQLKKDYKTLIIEDNCHSLFTKRNKEYLGNLGDISFNSLRKVIPVLSGSILVSNNSDICFLNEYKVKIPKIHQIINSLRGFISKSNKNIKHKKSLEYLDKDPYIDYFSYNIIKNNIFNAEKIRMIRSSNYLFWKEFLTNTDLIYFSSLILDRQVSPYAFPCKANNSDDVKKWIEWGRKKNINIIKWPNFPNNIMMKEIPKNLHHVLLFPVNDQFSLSLDRINNGDL